MVHAADESYAPALVILAAGASRRMGTCKALVDLHGRTPLEHLLHAGACFGEALIVTGHHDAEIRAYLASATALPPHRVTRNEAWQAGRSGSVQHAVACLPRRDLCLAPVDCPLVPAEVFEELRAACLAAGSPPMGWLSPRCAPTNGPQTSDARHGHPVIIGRLLLRSIARPDQSLRELRLDASPLLSVEVPHTAILENLDTQEDLQRLRAGA